MAGAPPRPREERGMTRLKPLHRLLADGRDADRPVCRDGARLVPWSAFAGRVGAQTAAFAARPETRWLLVSAHPLDFLVQLFALLHAGKQAVIPPNTQPGTLAQLAGAYDAVAADAPPATASPPLMPLSPLVAADAIVDLYTSGSTGEPKRVRKTLAQFEAEIDALETLWGATLGDAVVVATAPHHHIYGLLFRLLWPLAAGRAFDAATCAHPDTLGERLALLRDTALVSSPAQLARLPELVPLASLQPAPRLVFSSGGPLPAAAAAAFRNQLGQAPTEVFGSTETGGIAWRRQEDGADGTLWTPLPGVDVGADDDGALALRSPFLPSNAPWRMDDAVELLADGRFHLRGRLDRIVKIEEKRLSLPDLEARLGAHPWVAAAAAVALAGRRQTIGVVLVLTAEGRAQLAARGRRDAALELRRHLAEHFEAVLLPRRWRFPEQLPFNERGKLTQAELAALFAGDAELAAGAAAASAGFRRGLAAESPLAAKAQEDESAPA
ncbi:MAG: AMP-dependent synthetase [Candidatus Accumulibacter sp.]|nr:AMP-dependent synthetase [Accumulibacter sp.]